MSTTMTLTARGQFTFNKALMEHLGVRAGERVSIQKLPNGRLLLEAEKQQQDILRLSGSLVSLQMSDEALAKIIQLRQPQE